MSQFSSKAIRYGTLLACSAFNFAAIAQDTLREQLAKHSDDFETQLNQPHLGFVAFEGMQEDDSDDEAEQDQQDAAEQNELEGDYEFGSDADVDLDIESEDNDVDDREADEPAPRLNTLDLQDVISSVFQSYPVIIQSRQQAQVARGQLTEAWGSFDTKLKMQTLNESLGFYENYRHAIGASRQTWNGGGVYGGYRIGRGSFQPWYKERETDKGGEFKVGYRQALLQGRAIDPQRVAVYQASLDQKAVQPLQLEVLLLISRDAAEQYWSWVEAGLILQAQQSLLDLAEQRGEDFRALVKADKAPEIDLVLNKQLIAERRAKLIESRQKFQAASFKLSLFLRDQQGNPLVADPDLLPNEFPEIAQTGEPDLQAELVNALARRPEVRALEIQRQRLQYDQALACNQILPALNFIGEASQDMGEDASSSDDKDNFQLLLGLEGELPIQRRKARGKLISIRGKLQQLSQKQRLMRDKIQADLLIGFNELRLDAEVVEQALISLEAAEETLDAYRFAFDKGKIDLIYLNLLEVKANETEIKYLSALKQWHTALAKLRATLGLDPLAI